MTINKIFRKHQMRKYFVTLLLLLFVLKMNSQEVLEKNYNTFQEFLNEQNLNISKISNGFNELEVHQIMGESIVVNVPKVGVMKPLSQLFKQPHYTNIYKSNPKKEIKVLWYFSTPKDQNGLISKTECTPVVLENDVVVGLGWDYFNGYRRTNVLR